MSYGLEVKLVPHVGTDEKDTPAGRVSFEVEHNQFLVYVHSPEIYRPDNRMQVGIIGKQPGANFCPILAFYDFAYPQQQFIAEEAKRLHGQASTKPHVEIPPPEPEAWDDEEEELVEG